MSLDVPRYPPRIVCVALGIPHGTLSTWARRGLLANFSVASAERGKARLFDIADVLALALIKAASSLDVQFATLPAFSPIAAEAWLRQSPAIRELIIRRYAGDEGETSILYNDDAMKVPPKPGALVTITFNLTEIFTAALAALKAITEARSYGLEAEAIIEESAPLLDAVSRVYGPRASTDLG